MRELKEALRTYLIGQSTVTALVSSRIYPSHLAMVPSPTYPCVNIEISGGSQDTDIPKLHHPNFKIYVWSKNSQDEAWRIYMTIRDLLQNYYLTNTESRWYLQEETVPLELFDELEKIYYLSSSWRAEGYRV